MQMLLNHHRLNYLFSITIQKSTIKTLCLLLGLCLLLNSANARVNAETQNIFSEKLQKMIDLSFENPDSIITQLNNYTIHYLSQADTSKVIDCQLAAITILKDQLKYSEAFDIAWTNAVLVEESGSPMQIMKSYRLLGELYNSINQGKHSIDYFNKALAASKHIYKTDKKKGNELITGYFNLVMACNKYLERAAASSYLDSCYMYADSIQLNSIARGYIDTEKGIRYFLNDDLEKAEKTLLDVKNRYESIDDNDALFNKDKRFLVIIYWFIGDLYAHKKQWQTAAMYYQQSIDAIHNYKYHTIQEFDLLYKLAQMEAELGNYAKAYQLIHSSKIKHDNIYGNRSDIHQELYEIKSRHKQTVIEKDLEIAQKNKELYEKEKKLNRIKTYAMALIALCLVTLLFFINHKQRKKHQLRNAQNEKEIETKNKELTSFALQFIEKEKQVAELCEFVKDNVKDGNNKFNIIAKANKSRDDYWQEFNTRFMSLNQHFYETLNQRFNDLTSNDLRHCALIKLNFSTKEIADLMGISPKSVNMAHHRLRKKLALSQETNLTTFIANI